MDDYHYPKKGTEKLAKLYELKPDLMQAFRDFDGKVFAGGTLSTLVKELIAVAVAHTTQCPFCIASHTRRAKKVGASDAELAEAIFVAVALRAGGALAHGSVAMAALEDK